MRITLRLLGAIWLSVLVIVGSFAFFQIQGERERLQDDLEHRARLLSDALSDSVENLVRRGQKPSLVRLLKRFGQPERAIVVYDSLASRVALMPDGAMAPAAAVPEVTEALRSGTVRSGFRSMEGRKVYVHAAPLKNDEQTLGALLVVLDASHLDAAETGLWQYNAVRFFALALGLSLITAAMVRLSVTRPIGDLAEWARALKTGKAGVPPVVPDPKLFGPLAVEVSGLARTLYRAQAAVEQEAALRLAGESLWTEERLKQFVRLRLGGRPLFVVSNREPLSHAWDGGRIVAHTPASGVVTALEPVMRACGGVWVAHGSGDADREASDHQGRVGLPTEDPRYTLRRIWLSKEEEDGYYYGFANEGLWPLCHVVHVRPLFRASDWAHYRAVNRKFATALLEEMQGSEAPMVIIQDYHFALLPALIKAQRPDARVALFWHIPWPNFEAVGICPWQRDILEGMLGADLVGFHTQYHCNNFIDSIERTIEARIDAEHFAVIRGQHRTSVKPFPISVAPEFAEDPPVTSRSAVLADLGIAAEFLGVGVERVDYTKGLPERFLALQRFFERYPEYRERVVFAQIAAPSRSRIPRYRELQAEVEVTVAAVNRSLQTRNWRPIVYLERHFDRREIWPFYRYADFCMVTSLHDGMNLVAKEFVSVRDDGQAALILSRFTGASRELPDALLVNPYDLDETADAIRAALEMRPDERRSRMQRMHRGVREHNIYRWAGLLLDELERLPNGVQSMTAAHTPAGEDGVPTPV